MVHYGHGASGVEGRGANRGGTAGGCGAALTGVHDHDGREEPELGVVQPDGVKLQRELKLLQEEASHRHVRDLRPAHRQFTINVL